MKATRFQTGIIILKTIGLTLWVAIRTIYEAYRGTYRRTRCDQRLRSWSSGLLRFVGLSYETFNPHQVKLHRHQPQIIMSNHSSLYDIPLIFMALPGSIRMLTKKELFDVPIWGRGMKAGEFVSIDRSNRRQAFRALEEAAEKMKSGIILWVAPEGTRSTTGDLGEFKKGGFLLALRTGARIIPVGIRGAHKVLPAKTFDFHIGQHAEIHIGKPIDTSPFNKKNVDQLMLTVEQQIRRLADLSPSAQHAS